MAKLAPVIIFVYCRRKLTQQLIESLEKNKYVNQTELYIFADIPLAPNKKALSQEVIDYIHEYQKVSRFKRVYIQVASRHKGLACSVIDGVTSVIHKHGKAIVLEDDLMVSEDFLEFMQKALVYYQGNPKIWSVTGNTEKLPSLSRYPHSVYMSYRGNSWGWGTWKDRWDVIDWSVRDYSRFRHNPIKRILFNRGGNDLSHMLDLQMTDKSYDSWAIRSCYQQFKLRLYTVYPTENRVMNMDAGNQATHSLFVSTMPLKTVYKAVHFENLKIHPRLARELKLAYAPSRTRQFIHYLSKAYK